MIRYTPLAFLLAGTLLLGLACSKDKDQSSQSQMKKMDPNAAAGSSLWDRLGGEPAVSKVVHDFVVRGAKDPRVNFTRQGHANTWEATPGNVARLERRLVEFISAASGGPLTYQGGQMGPVHQGMNITDAEFNALARHLSDALDAAGVQPREKGELMAAVAGTREDIVGK